MFGVRGHMDSYLLVTENSESMQQTMQVSYHYSVHHSTTVHTASTYVYMLISA